MKIYLPLHFDGGNRGCEAITEATSILLKGKEVISLSRNIDLDFRLGLDKYTTLVREPKDSLPFRMYRKVICLFGDYFSSLTFKRHYRKFVDGMRKDDIMLSTGGDMLCYNNNQVIYTNELAKSKGIKTILWGCSVGKENLTSEKNSTLLRFDYIYCRESITESLMKEIGCTKVGLFPDPAFILEPQSCDLPSCFDGVAKVIGLNVSNYVVGSNDISSTEFGNALRVAVDYLLSSSDYHILIIPHVLWGEQDDRIISNVMLREYGGTSRLSLLDSDKLNYRQIRYVISKCYAFCGARTHSVISAYSTCVPTIALGYSVKSKGIAKDLQLPEQSLVDSKHLTGPNDLMDAFKFVLENHDELMNHLSNIMPSYKQKVYGIRDIVENL